MHLKRLWTAGIALATVATGVTVALTAAAPPASATVLPNGFRSIGYMPSWAGNVNSIQYNKLTHINYAFVLPNSNGTLQGVPDGGKLSQLVTLAHNNGVKVSLSIGGWSDGN